MTKKYEAKIALPLRKVSLAFRVASSINVAMSFSQFGQLLPDKLV